jgi:TatD DNase family protein
MKLVDSHCHLEMIADTAGAVVEARGAGVEQLITIGIDLETSRQAAALAATLAGVYATVGLHPHEAHLLDDALLAEFEELAARPRVVAVGEAGLDFYRDLSPRDAQRRAFSAQIELARRPEYVDECNERGYYASFAGNVTYKNAGELREAAMRVRGDRIMVETDAPFLTPVPNRGNSNVPAWVAHTAALVAEVRGVPAAELAELTTANARRVFGLAEAD